MTNIDINSPRLITRESFAAVVFAAAGIYWFSPGNWLYGLAGLILGLILGFLYKGFGFDLSAKRYRVYTGLFQWRFGGWEPLPSVVGVTVKYFSQLTTSGEPGRLRTDKSGEYILMLSIENSANGVILQRFGSNQAEYALELGKRVANVFDVRLTSFLPYQH